MSAINNALSELSKSQTTSINDIERVQVQAIKQKPRLPWLIAGFSLSLAVGGWAISLQAPEERIELADASDPITQAPFSNAALDAVSKTASVASRPSPTAKVTQASDAIYSAPIKPAVTPVVHDVSKPVVSAKIATSPMVHNAVVVDAPIVESQTIEKPLANVTEQSIEDKPRLLARNDNHLVSDAEPNAEIASGGANAKHSAVQLEDGAIVVEQVELTPTQLSFNAQERAKKALDANNLSEAIAQYNDAIRYTPRDSKVRQTLAALYYGKGDARKAVDLLQKGIAIDNDDMSVRLALSKLLLKEKQTAAALTPLVYLPNNPTSDYLSLRAALAQKNNQDPLALESYQSLVALEPENGRWWLGYGIQLEREFEIPKAKQAYQQALTKVGISSQSQQFIRDRLNVLTRLEEQPSAD
ncbi:MSHA biogenesis protein MshN [Vibrio ichthyoenteri ATCC 700023]|uniref:MSHA biogenesis protein MshN n=1 Tax=Vibrio ichthyoenteri ATCC 700023 TaxID=870968 RepID=F9S1H3_9VIBR|nr:tetratricopeptide repeat protein [Vibrio ichthyoenteri]EGU41679.1 MSHA biogenesis protein MshN [Vibrio ichthyoenteri ATCC 700023]